MSSKARYDKMDFQEIVKERDLLEYHASRFKANARDKIAVSAHHYLMMEKEKNEQKNS